MPVAPAQRSNYYSPLLRLPPEDTQKRVETKQDHQPTPAKAAPSVTATAPRPIAEPAPALKHGVPPIADHSQQPGATTRVKTLAVALAGTVFSSAAAAGESAQAAITNALSVLGPYLDKHLTQAAVAFPNKFPTQLVAVIKGALEKITAGNLFIPLLDPANQAIYAGLVTGIQTLVQTKGIPAMEALYDASQECVDKKTIYGVFTSNVTALLQQSSPAILASLNNASGVVEITQSTVNALGEYVAQAAESLATCKRPGTDYLVYGLSAAYIASALLLYAVLSRGSKPGGCLDRK